jgi:hypothetical protein
MTFTGPAEPAAAAAAATALASGILMRRLSSLRFMAYSSRSWPEGVNVDNLLTQRRHYDHDFGQFFSMKNSYFLLEQLFQ